MLTKRVEKTRQMVTRHHGDHLEMYRNIESLCCASGTNIVLEVSYSSKTNKYTYRKRDQIWGYQRHRLGRGSVGYR